MLARYNFIYPVCIDENDSLNKLNHFPSNLEVTYKAEHPEHFNKTITVYCNIESSPLVLKIMRDAEYLLFHLKNGGNKACFTN